MDKNKRLPYLGILILCLALFLPSCSPFPRSESEQEEKAFSELTIAYQEDSFLLLPLYIAIKEGFFEKENLTIKLEKTTTQEAIEGLSNGEYGLLIGGPENGFYSYQRGAEDKLIFIGQLASKSGYFLLTRKNEKPFTWSEVKGKVIIGVNSGESPQLALENILRGQHLRPYLDVHLINNLPAELRMGIFQSGTGQFILSQEPTATILEKEEWGQVVTSLDEHLAVNLPTVLIVTAKLYQENQELYQGFSKGLEQGLIWVENNSPVEIAEIAQEFFPEQEEKTLLRGIGRYKNMGCWPETSELTEKELQELQQILLEAQELNSPLPLYELFTSFSGFHG